MTDESYHETPKDKEFDRLREMMEKLESEAVSWPHRLNAAEYRAAEDMTAKGMALRANLESCRPEDINTLRRQISAWYLQANQVLIKPSNRLHRSNLTHLFGLMIFTLLWGIWVFKLHTPAHPLASIATADTLELERLANAGLQPVILSVFPRIMLFSLLGTFFYLAGSLLRRNDRTAGLRHLVALVCATPTAVLLSVFLAANLVTKARELMLEEYKKKAEGLLGGWLAKFTPPPAKAPPEAHQIANFASEAKRGLTEFSGALSQAETVFRTFIGTNEATIYFYTSVISAMLPYLLILLYSRLLTRPTRWGRD